MRERVLALVRTHGWNTTSFQALEEGFSYWFDDDNNACVAYVDTGAAWVAAGAPIAAADHIDDVCDGFAAAAKTHGRRACFFALEDRVIERKHLSAMRIGLQPSWQPSLWQQKLTQSRSLREQLRRAKAKSVTVRLVDPSELSPTSSLRTSMNALAEAWLQTRKMAPMGFLVDVQPFSFARERRTFIAERDGALVGFLVAVPIYVRRGWLFQHLLRSDDAPNGTNELLFDAAMRHVAVEGSELVTLGMAPLAGEVPAALRAVRAASRVLYDFEGLQRFKSRLRPDAWESVYLGWPRRRAGTVALYDALSAFTMRGDVTEASLLRFGMTTVQHRATRVASSAAR